MAKQNIDPNDLVCASRTTLKSKRLDVLLDSTHVRLEMMLSTIGRETKTERSASGSEQIHVFVGTFRSRVGTRHVAT